MSRAIPAFHRGCHRFLCLSGYWIPPAAEIYGKDLSIKLHIAALQPLNLRNKKGENSKKTNFVVCPWELFSAENAVRLKTFKIKLGTAFPMFYLKTLQQKPLNRMRWNCIVWGGRLIQQTHGDTCALSRLPRFKYCLWLPVPDSCRCTPWDAANEGWVPASHVGNLQWIPGSWLNHGH